MKRNKHKLIRTKTWSEKKCGASFRFASMHLRTTPRTGKDSLVNSFRQERAAIKSQLNENALETRAHSLAKKAFYALKPSNPQKERTNDRSKLYSLFSNWKFYAKERSLLKKYLIQCGESPTNMSLMSTGLMRDQADTLQQDSL